MASDEAKTYTVDSQTTVAINSMDPQNEKKEAFGAPPAYYTSCQMEQVVPISQMNKFDIPCKVTPGPTVDVTQEGFQWSSRIFYMSMCSTLCCGFFGMIATAWSILAYVDSRFKDFGAMARKQRTARCCMYMALLTGLILLIMVGGRAFCLSNNYVQSHKNQHWQHHQQPLYSDWRSNETEELNASGDY